MNSNLGMEPFRRNLVFASVDMILVHELAGPATRETAARVRRRDPPQGLFEFSYGQVSGPSTWSSWADTRAGSCWYPTMKKPSW